MKKTIVISLIIAFCLTGCSLGKKKTAENTQTATDTTLLGQLKNSDGVVCKVVTLNGEVVVNAKGSNIKIEGIPYIYDQATSSTETVAPNNSGTMLTISEEQYVWSDQKGIKFDQQELSDLIGGQTEEQMDAKDWQTTVDEWQQAGFSYKCEKQNLADDVFALPADVEFTDLVQTLLLLQNLTQQASSTSDIISTSSDVVSNENTDVSPENISVSEIDN